MSSNFNCSYTTDDRRRTKSDDNSSHGLKARWAKKGDKHAVENYRPVSLTSVPCKLLEHIIMQANNIIKSRFQIRQKSFCNNSFLTLCTGELHIKEDFTASGRSFMWQRKSNSPRTVPCGTPESTLNHDFRSGYSYETQLIVTLHDFMKAYDAGLQTDVAILDFSKAFDIVPHKKLLSKMDLYGIRGPINNWLNMILSHLHSVRNSFLTQVVFRAKINKFRLIIFNPPSQKSFCNNSVLTLCTGELHIKVKNKLVHLL
jgi:hypothetical protein